MDIILNNTLLKTPNLPIADLHCDLLCYLSKSKDRSPYDLISRCAIPQLKQGNVRLQTLAIFTETSPGSSKRGLAQVDAFKDLLKNHSDTFEPLRRTEQFKTLLSSEKIGILPAIENASSFCEEDDDLESALNSLTAVQHRIGKMGYVSLTWNTENRFGGGALTQKGLKSDGKRLIEYLSEHNIPLDLSHASDALANESINYIDKDNLKVPLIASHSNFRTVSSVPRNLPTELAKEILRRNGLIGLNFVRPFVGASPANFVSQLECALTLGESLLESSGICFGADFFHTEDVSKAHRKPPEELFFPSFDHAGTYGNLLSLWNKNLTLAPKLLQDICYNNIAAFFTRNRF